MNALMDIFNMQILKNTLLAKRKTYTTHRITVVKKNKSKLGTMNSEFQSWACDHVVLQATAFIAFHLRLSACVGRDLYLCTPNHLIALLNCCCYITV